MQKEKTKNQHVVPQTWLKRFTYNSKATSTYVFSKNEDENLGTKSISKVFTYDYFYDFHEEVFQKFVKLGALKEEDNQYVEKEFLSYDIENKLGMLLKEVISQIEGSFSNKNVLKSEQVSSLIFQISMLVFRGISFREYLVQCLDFCIKFMKNNGIDYSFEPEKELERVHFLLMNDEDSIIELLTNRDFIIYKTTDDYPFIIGDNPVVAFNSQKIFDDNSNKNTIAVPLSKNYLIAFPPTPLIESNTVSEISPEQVNFINNVQYHQSIKQICSPNNDFSWINRDMKFLDGIGFDIYAKMPKLYLQLVALPLAMEHFKIDKF